MKLCTCKTCDRVFAATKVKPFCSGVCRRQYVEQPQTPTQANLVGANINESTSNTNQACR